METRIGFSAKSRISEKINRKGRLVPVQNDQAPFLYCHIVAIVVKLIYGTGIGNDGMDGSELMENLLNSIKPLYVAVEGFLGILCTD